MNAVFLTFTNQMSMTLKGTLRSFWPLVRLQSNVFKHVHMHVDDNILNFPTNLQVVRKAPRNINAQAKAGKKKTARK